jgi:glycosyltransferase involved in cell wall biosynthesis
MNLMIYISYLRGIYRSTGPGRVARQLTEHFAASEEVSLQILGSRQQKNEMVPKVGRPWSEYDYKLYDLSDSLRRYLWYFFRTPAADSYWNKVDLVYSTGEAYVPTKDVPFAVTVHDAAFFEPERRAHEGQWLQRKKWRLLYRRLSKTADLFHTVSEFSAERIAHFFPSLRDRICVVPNAVAPQFFESVPDEGREYVREMRLDHRPFVLLPRGLHYRKNADLVLEAWPAIQEANPDLLLVVTSHNDPEYVRKAKDRMGDSIIITDFISDAALHALYSRARLVWIPSRYEGFGLPVVEAMAQGTPVVASNASALPEVTGEAGVLVPVNQPRKHVEAIHELIHDEQKQDELCRAGRERAGQFTWSQSAQKLLKEFRRLV